MTMVGRHGEVGDVFAPSLPMPVDVHPGDLVAVPASGAYQYSMASNYHFVGRPPVIAVDEGRSQLLIRRETEDDLLARDLGRANKGRLW